MKQVATVLAMLLLATAVGAEPVKDPFRQPELWTKLAALEVNQIADFKTCCEQATLLASAEARYANDETRPELIEALDTARDRLTNVLPDEKGIERRNGLVRVAEQFARLGSADEADETLVLAGNYNDLLPTSAKMSYEVSSAWLGAVCGSMDYGLDTIAKLPEAERNGAYWNVMQHLHATGGDLAVSEKILGRMTPAWVTGWARQDLIKTYAARGNEAAAERLVAATDVEKRAEAVIWLTIGQSLAKNWDGYAKTIDRLPPTVQATQLPHLARHYFLAGKKDAADSAIGRARILAAGLKGAEQRRVIDLLIDYDCLISGEFKDAQEWLAMIPDSDTAKFNRRMQLARAQALTGDTAPAKALLPEAKGAYDRAFLLSSLAAAGGTGADDYRKQARAEVMKLYTDPEKPVGRSTVMESLMVAGHLETLGEWIQTLPDAASRRTAYSGVAWALRKQHEYLEK